MVYKSAVQVNLFSWPSHANTDKQLEGKRREFISSWKYSNSPFLSPSQQAPLVSQERLHSVVHKVAGNNKFKGKRILLIKDQQTNEHKVMTSLTHSRQTVECNNQQVYSCKYPKKSETNVIASIYQYKDSMQSVKPAGKQEERDANLSHLHQNDVMDDAINAERVGFIASNSHTAPERSCSYEKENSYSLANVTKSFFIQMACIFMVIENMIKSVISRNLLNLKRVVGLATGASVSWECCVIAISRPTNISYAFGGKRSYAYSSLNLVIYASWLRQFGRYIYNLDFEYATRGYYKLVYYCIRVFHSAQLIWNQATLSSEFATLFCNKLYTLVYLVSEWSFSGIINDDKYHRQFLFGLTLVCKAIMLNQCFLLHFYANWEELRPLVTSRAYDIKEGFNPCVIQKQFMRWYALVTPGPQDHSYPRVWCNTRPLGPLSARVWCNTRPPGPLQQPSGELVIPATPSWNFPGIVPLHSWTFLLESYQDSRTTSRSPPWNSRCPSTPCLVKTRPLGFLTSRLQVRGRNCTTRYLKCSSVRF